VNSHRLYIPAALVAVLAVPLFAIADTITVSTTGASQAVYEQTTAGICTSGDWLDSPARAWWHPSDGTLHLITPSGDTYPFIGSSLDSIHHDCGQVLMRSAGNPDYNAAEDTEWPTAVLSLDGTNAYALVHDEWHRACGGTAWVNSITVAQSTDDGLSFVHPTDYQIRVAPTLWSDSFCAANPIFGSFNPTNIIGKDGWYYAMFMSGAAPIGAGGGSGMCIMRSKSIGSGSAWQVWTAARWAQANVTPTCKPVYAGTQITSINYDTYLRTYVALLINGGGVYVLLSDDLLNWSAPLQISGVAMTSAQGALAYPSLLSNSNDSSVTGLNFEKHRGRRVAVLHHTQRDQHRIASPLPHACAGPLRESDISAIRLSRSRLVRCRDRLGL
jgi:hypothetical protein